MFIQKRCHLEKMELIIRDVHRCHLTKAHTMQQENVTLTIAIIQH